MSDLGEAMWAPVRHATPIDPHELPTCMCGILKRAVEDAMAIQETPGYKLNMGSWHEPNGTCKVCMAGAVMARTLKADRDYYWEPTDFPRTTEYVLYAVNNMRMGNLEGAYRQIYGHAAKPTGAQLAAIQKAHSIIGADYVKHQGRGYASWAVYLEAVEVLAAVGL